MELLRFDGHIVGAGFASGHTIVAGRWRTSPLGPFADAMWRRPDGSRVLFAPTDDVEAFVERHYTFEDARVARVRVERDAAGVVRLTAGPIELVLRARRRGIGGRLLRVRPQALRERPAWITIEDTVLRPLVSPLFAASDVRVRGRTRNGAREWYAIHDVLPADATATIAGEDLGDPSLAPAPAGFGFSEIPATPSIVRVTSLIERR
ncbi:MAG TPA: hypothetical protein VLA82_02810 [Actinomycetota bacterium]|nr:hypothetical protein [Actinomycetota bacterium]